MRKSYYTLDVFTNQRFTGNPLAVVGDAQSLSDAQMQAIAREFNLSETVFLCPPQTDTSLASLRIFTPSRELPFAGHPTIGTAILMAELMGIEPEADSATNASDFQLDLRIGAVPISISRENGVVRAQFTAPKDPWCVDALSISAEAWAALLGVAADDIDVRASGIYSAGNDFAFVALRSRAALARCQPDVKALAEQGIGAIYPVFIEKEGLVHARMFGAGLGVSEDPATGSAAAALPAFLAARDPQARGEKHWQIRQGEDMGRPSEIDLSYQHSEAKVTQVQIAGTAVRVSEGQIDIGSIDPV